MWISRYFVYFVIFSFFGWIYESIYCTIKSKRWENRGFLYGPLCPIYGAGGVGITAIADVISIHTDTAFTWWQIFIVAFSEALSLSMAHHGHWKNYFMHTGGITVKCRSM